MAVTLIEGFRRLPSAAYDRVGISNASSGTSTWSRITGKAAGLYAVQCANSSSTDGVSQSGSIRVPLSGSATFAVGWSRNQPKSGGGVACNIGGFVLPDTDGNTIWWGGIGAGYSVQGFNVGTSMSATVIKNGAIISPGLHWWCITAVHGSSSAGHLRLYCDGTLMAEVAPDTLSSGTYAPPSSLRLYVGNSNASAESGCQIGDIVVTDTAELIPESRVDVLVPDGTTTAQWVGSDGNSVDNHLLVDDAGPALDTADYVQSDTVGALDTYTIGNLPHAPASIQAVQVAAKAAKISGSDRTMAVQLNSAESTALNPGAGGTVSGVWDTDPATGSAWTTSGVNGMTAGITIKT